jgi:hypothetical protein
MDSGVKSREEWAREDEYATRLENSETLSECPLVLEHVLQHVIVRD